MKIFLSIISTLIILFIGFIILMFFLLAGFPTFYAVMTISIFLILLCFINMKIWNLLKNKKGIVFFWTLLGVVFLSSGVFGIWQTWDTNIEQIDEQSINLALYEPFKANSKVVMLENDSTLKLMENLPKLDGATALYPLYSAFVQAVYPEGYYPYYFEKNDEDLVVCTQTNGAYQRLISGNADIIFVAGPSKEQLKMAENLGIELIFTPIGYEAFVFFVNSKNPVDNLSINDIHAIYSGTIKNWKDIGGKNAEIKAFQRPENSGSQTALIKYMGEIQLMDPPKEDVADVMSGIISKVSSYKNYNSAIGYSFLFYATEMVRDNKIKLLSVNGIKPTRENVSNGIYPYTGEFYAVTVKTDNPNIQFFIDWILSEQGQELVAKTGYSPLSKN